MVGVFIMTGPYEVGMCVRLMIYPNPGFHKTKYKNRHRVENIFARLKHLRSIAMRYDELKVMYDGNVKLGHIIIWLGLKV